MKQQIQEKHIAHSTKQTIKKSKQIFCVIMNFFEMDKLPKYLVQQNF